MLVSASISAPILSDLWPDVHLDAGSVPTKVFYMKMSNTGNIHYKSLIVLVIFGRFQKGYHIRRWFLYD